VASTLSWNYQDNLVLSALFLMVREPPLNMLEEELLNQRPATLEGLLSLFQNSTLILSMTRKKSLKEMKERSLGEMLSDCQSRLRKAKSQLSTNTTLVEIALFQSTEMEESLAKNSMD
jgi:hypothetical protein